MADELTIVETDYEGTKATNGFLKRSVSDSCINYSTNCWCFDHKIN